MGIGVERSRTLVNYIDIKIKYKHSLSNKLKTLISKFRGIP